MKSLFHNSIIADFTFGSTYFYIEILIQSVNLEIVEIPSKR